jgi:hypothetical protein
MGINFEWWQEGHIEFRHLGGTDYHKKWNEIKNTVARYARAFLIACDPEAYKDEYLKRLARISHQLESFRHRKLVEHWSAFNMELEAEIENIVYSHKRNELTKLLKWSRMKRSKLGGMGFRLDDKVCKAIESRSYIIDPIKAYARRQLTIAVLKYMMKMNVRIDTETFVLVEMSSYLNKIKRSKRRSS